MSMWVAGAAVVGSVGGALISANGAKSAASSSTDANLQNTAATNAANLNLFNLSRGGTNPSTGYGNAILPTYFGGNEQAAGQTAYDQFNQLNGLAQGNYNSSLAYQSQLGNAANSATNNLSNRFNGQYLQQQQQYSNPYYQSVLNNAGVQGGGLRQVAAANSSAINTGLAQTLSQINAQRASQGFLGGSTYDQNRLASATIGARQAAAVNTATANSQANNLTAAAQLGNAGDLRSMQLSNLDYASNPNNLSSGMGALQAYQSAPANALSAAYTNAQQPLNFFRLQPQAFQQQNMPQQTPQISSDQIYGTALSQGSQAAGNYALMNQLSSQYGAQGGYGVNPYTSMSSQLSAGAAYANGGIGGYVPSVNAGANSFLNFGGATMAPSNGAFNYNMGALPNPVSMYNPGP